MPTTNARKHTIPAGTDTTITRQTIFEEFGNTIRDIVPVANTTERALLVAALTAADQGPSSARPLFVYRDDARGVHRVELTIDGTVWIPVSGILEFASKSAADVWATANPSYLTVKDTCRVVGVEYRWSGTAWLRAVYADSIRLTTGGTSITASTLTSIVQLVIPADAPAGRYLVHASQTTVASADGAHYMRVQAGATELSSYIQDFINAVVANRDVRTSDVYVYNHAGGAAVTITLQSQVNAVTPSVRSARLTVEFVG